MATLVDIPPELIDAIVEHIPDVASLKSCSLVSPIFRFPCQKRLHHSLDLIFAGPDSQRDPRRTLEAVSRRFEESPHLAGFVTRLFVQLVSPWCGADNQSVSARLVFDVIGQVKKAKIVAPGHGPLSWSSSPPGLQSAVLEWLARRGSTEPLEELFLMRLSLPEAALPVVCSAAAFLFVHHCALEAMPTSQQQATFRSVPPLQTRTLRRFEAHSSWSVLEWLGTTRKGGRGHVTVSDLALHISNDKTALEKFSRLCASSADTLTSLQLWTDLQSIDSELKTFLLQKFTTILPCLCEVRVRFQHESLGLNTVLLDNSLWVFQSALRPALLPRLTQITYVVPIAYSPDGAGLPGTFESDWSTPYDEFVVDHPTLTSFIWEPTFFRGDSPGRPTRGGPETAAIRKVLCRDAAHHAQSAREGTVGFPPR
uniref:F-box domain-containing protein n=1 Tax=Mycena chlorophos TaxID=658473 RepID=A0ABQ0LCN6_MYCCL|nr:predicted protein [Mycena chlorophos]